MRLLLSKIFALVVFLRNTLYDLGWLPIHRVSIPVVCVGNIVVGGSGKTPLVQIITKLLLEEGKRPVVLSRGYGGRDRGPTIVTANKSAIEVGDEPLLLFQTLNVPVVIAKDRVQGAKFIDKENIGDCIVLDDGYQHRRLDRNLNILTFDVRSDEVYQSVEGNKHLPHGLLRESVDQGLKRADLIVANHRGPKLETTDVARLLPLLSRSTFDAEIWIKGGMVTSSDGNNGLEQGTEIVAISGIARPEGFHQLLESLGYKITKKVVLKDHDHSFEQEVAILFDSGSSPTIVCTEKDLVRIQNRSLKDSLYSLKPEYAVDQDGKRLLSDKLSSL